MIYRRFQSRIGFHSELNPLARVHNRCVVTATKLKTDFGCTPGSYDAHNPLQQLLTLDGEGQGTWNAGRYSNPKVEELTDLIAKETDDDKRNAMISEAYKIHRDDVGHIPLHQQALAWGIGSKVKEVKQRPHNDVDLRYVMMK